MNNKGSKRLGTVPVFLTGISTILGAILFLRFGYAVGNVGLLGTFLIVIVGHLVTIPTALAIAEIATNRKVEGGGEYYIISRSFGITIGSTIGVALYMSQAISVAFYIIAFSEAFRPVFSYVNETFGLSLSDTRIISVPSVIILGILMLTKGADLGVKVLYVVAAILFASLLLFFLGSTGYNAPGEPLLGRTVDNPDAFFFVFAIIFPAFTGMTAGVGLSGDLKKPGKSIPIGTIAATVTGMIVYFFIAYKMTVSASPEDLSNDQFIMEKIALWGPIIPIGLAAATISSALGSIMVAPRTLQALGNDSIFPIGFANRWLARGKGDMNEPVNASIVTIVIALGIIFIGDVNFVASIISMFFMVTYGSLCLISFLEHFSADPSYRPMFHSRWYLSLLGAGMCLLLMFLMSPPYALLALVVMTLLYISFRYAKKEERGLANLFLGAIFQLSRNLQIILQKTKKGESDDHWRPSVICISKKSLERLDAFNLLRWIAQRYGFGTYIHLIKGFLNKDSYQESRQIVDKLIAMAEMSESNVYIDTIISPSNTTAVAQILQLPGISGKENNTILFEYDEGEDEYLDVIIDNFALVKSTNFDVGILRTGERNYGYFKEIHVWLTHTDYDNANLMILLSYIILGHRDWRNAKIKMYALFPQEEISKQRENLHELIQTGRLPISLHNVQFIVDRAEQDYKEIISEHSFSADLTLIGFRESEVERLGVELFKGFHIPGNILFLNTDKSIIIE